MLRLPNPEDGFRHLRQNSSARPAGRRDGRKAPESLRTAPRKGAGAECLPGDACDLPCVFFREGGTGRIGRERMAELAAAGALSLQAAGSLWALHALGLFEREAPL